MLVDDYYHNVPVTLLPTLKDNNSNTGTFVDNVELTPRERRIIAEGTLFTIGATSIILRTADGGE